MYSIILIPKKFCVLTFTCTCIHNLRKLQTIIPLNARLSCSFNLNIICTFSFSSTWIQTQLHYMEYIWGKWVWTQMSMFSLYWVFSPNSLKTVSFNWPYTVIGTHYLNKFKLWLGIFNLRRWCYTLTIWPWVQICFYGV